MVSKAFLLPIMSDSGIACVRQWLPYACLLLALAVACPASAEPELMTDTELDAVSARGTGTEEDGTFIDLGGLLAQISPDGNEVSFSFDTGNLLGNGSMAATAPGAVNPSAFSFAGLGGGQPIFFENLILNLNVCTSCKAGGDIIQNNLGLILDTRK